MVNDYETSSHRCARRGGGNGRVQAYVDLASSGVAAGLFHSGHDSSYGATFHALHLYCEGDEITVGTAIHIEHRAASLVGARIRAEAVVESFDGRFYTVRVKAWDDQQEIGRGTVGRAVVSVGKFLERIRKV